MELEPAGDGSGNVALKPVATTGHQPGRESEIGSGRESSIGSGIPLENANSATTDSAPETGSGKEPEIGSGNDDETGSGEQIRSQVATTHQPGRESEIGSGRESSIGSGIPLENANSATTDKPGRVTGWRIEINRRKKAGDGFKFHWIWRLTFEGGKRRGEYGGTLATVPPERLKQYKKNSRKAAQRKEHENQ